MSRDITVDELAKHKSAQDGIWIAVDGKVYDVTEFADDHPGGKKILVNSAGKDASEAFWRFHSKRVLEKTAKPMQIGVVGLASKNSTLGDPEKQQAKIIQEHTDQKKIESSPNEATPAPTPDEHIEDEDSSYFGDLVPFGDPNWYQDWASPYYDDSHRKLRAYIRKFVDEEVVPNVFDWDENRILPPEFIKSAGDKGILAAVVGGKWPLPWAKGIPVPGGVDPAKWNGFHDFVVVDELSRSASGGFIWGLLGGLGIGLPPIIKFGSSEMQNRIIPECLRGNKRICLAITEPSGGSDVANLETTARKTPDGKHYIVNGEKKWITNGIWCDYFTVAVRTGGEGMGGISLLLVERSFGGVSTRKMDCMGVWSSGTSYVTFEDVKVPVENLIGKENKGFQLIMANFNGERLGICIQANRFSRCLLEESIKYASKRKTFGVLLRDHQVIRNKIAHMARMVEATHAWIENIVYQSTVYEPEDMMLRMGGAIALCKAQSTKTFEYCAAESMQIFGGVGYTRGGQGEKVERLYREVRAFSIPGGSEEIMLDLGIRQSIKVASIMGAKL